VKHGDASIVEELFQVHGSVCHGQIAMADGIKLVERKMTELVQIVAHMRIMAVQAVLELNIAEAARHGH
jgi:hypothetical protein